MGGILGGSQSTSTDIPDWLEDAARRNISRADEISTYGYTPYYGPDVASFTPMQQSSFQNTGQAAGAFGLAGGGASGMGGLPQGRDFGGGVMGYSGAPLFEGSLQALQDNRPGQYDAITGMFIDPVTGAAPRSPFGPLTGPAVAPGTGGGFGVGGGPDNAELGGFPGGSGGGFMGYSGVGDMMDGGGPGASGDQFSGGGMVSTIGNAVGGPSGIGGGK